MATEMCRPGCSWNARILKAGTHLKGGQIPRQLLPRFAELLPFVPVRAWFDKTSGLLRHPASLLDAPDPDSIIGVVVRAWIDAPFVCGVLHFCTEAAGVRRALLRMERDQVLRLVGVSIAALVKGQSSVTSVEEIRAVDLVSRPAMEGCGLMYRIPCAGRPQPLTTSQPDEEGAQRCSR